MHDAKRKQGDVVRHATKCRIGCSVRIGHALGYDVGTNSTDCFSFLSVLRVDVVGLF